MYIHCHSCPWEQDDFWTSSYNPFTVLMSDIKWLWFPKMVRTEKKEFSWVVLARCIYWAADRPLQAEVVDARKLEESYRG